MNANPAGFHFHGVTSGIWVDPPLAIGFEYSMDSDSLFTAIEAFPQNFGSYCQKLTRRQKGCYRVKSAGTFVSFVAEFVGAVGAVTDESWVRAKRAVAAWRRMHRNSPHTTLLLPDRLPRDEC